MWECHQGRGNGLRAGRFSTAGYAAFLQLAILVDGAGDEMISETHIIGGPEASECVF